MNHENEMENSDRPYLLCSGENCGKKTDCKRFRRDLNMKKEDHFAWPPLKPDGSCNEFDPKNEMDYLFDKIKNICDGGTENR